MAKKCIVSMHRPIGEYRAVLFDVDGTLYMQRGLRATMAKSLAVYFLMHPLRIRELFALMHYRHSRESWDSIASKKGRSQNTMEQEQYLYTAQKLHMPVRQVRDTVTRWIHAYPLKYLPRYKDQALCSLLCQLKKQGIVIAAYSDYPAAEKLDALNVRADYVFCSLDESIDCMKPDVKAMRRILTKLALPEKEILMIGDRYSKDGLTAKNVGMDYLILNASPLDRRKLYRKLKNCDIISL